MDTTNATLRRIIRYLNAHPVRDLAKDLGTSPIQLSRCRDPRFLGMRSYLWVTDLDHLVKTAQRKARKAPKRTPRKKKA